MKEEYQDVDEQEIDKRCGQQNFFSLYNLQIEEQNFCIS
jgi:hypothetical protein